MTAFTLQTLLLLALAFLLGLALGLMLARRGRPAGGLTQGHGTEPRPVSSPVSPLVVSPLAEVSLLGRNSTSAHPADPAVPEVPSAERARPAAGHGVKPASEAEPDLFSSVAPAAEPAPAEPPASVHPAPADGDTHPGLRPPALDAPEGGMADDLKLLKGIGPQNERRLHALGIFHFRQIAAWTPDEVAWVGSSLAFSGRIEREDWIGQAKALAAGATPPAAGEKPGH